MTRWTRAIPMVDDGHHGHADGLLDPGTWQTRAMDPTDSRPGPWIRKVGDPKVGYPCFNLGTGGPSLVHGVVAMRNPVEKEPQNIEQSPCRDTKLGQAKPGKRLKPGRDSNAKTEVIKFTECRC